MRKLYVSPADYADVFNDAVCLLLQSGLKFGADGEHRCNAERIPRVNAHRVNVLDEAHGYHVVVFVADYLKFEFLPAQHGFFNENLMHYAGLKPAFADCSEFVAVVHEAAARSSHRVGRTEDYGITQLFSDSQSFVNGLCGL